MGVPMKTLLLTVGIFALLPFALPAILVSVLIVATIAYWLVPVLWVLAAVFVIAKIVKWGAAEWKQSQSSEGF